MDSIKVQAPGRINIIGEHTDYNQGLVLPAAIEKNTIFTITKNNTADQIKVIAGNLNETFSFNLNDFVPIERGWQNYIMGVVSEIQKVVPFLKGFDAEFSGNVPIGSGMSSSASLECALAYALNKLFNLGLNEWQLIKNCQKAEHNFVGIQCGIMDQFASIMGKKDKVLLLDCRNLEYQYFSIDLQRYQFLLINTNVRHELASSEYNTRKLECNQAVKIIQKCYPKINSLRDVSMEILQTQMESIPEHIYQRARHVISENKRVLAATVALQNKDFKSLGELMYQSHESLRNDYKVSCDELNYLVDFTLELQYVLGSRMMGGGFGGCTINIVEKTKLKAFKNDITLAFTEQFGNSPSIYEITIENGAGIIQ